MLIFRGTPLIVQIFFVYFGANLLFGFTLIPRTVDFGVFRMDGAAFAGILALGINEGAYMREIIRAGIDAVDAGCPGIECVCVVDLAAAQKTTYCFPFTS